VDARLVVATDAHSAADAVAYRRLNAAYQQSLRYAADVRRLYVQLQRGVYQSLLGLANAIEAKDSYTRGHSDRVSRWSRHLAVALDLEPPAVEVIGQAGLLHDLGKIGVPEHVLRKSGPLAPSEWELMKRHPLIGADIVAPLEFFAGGALVIRHHHERIDGSGYPDALRGERIPVGARIVAVADVFDALTSDRPYRRALTPDAALAHLASEAGRTLDEDIVATFIGLVRADGAAD
jgi:HD-GYP domain-containing protein (c-di-GMP phosphodiesterase class II)